MLGNPLRGHAHVHIFPAAPQAIMHRCVDDFAVAHAVAGTGLGQQVRALAHALHTPGHVHVPLPGTNGVGGQHHRLQAGSAHFVDGQGTHGGGNARFERGVARGGHACPCLDDVAHDDLFDDVGRDARAFDGRANNRGSQVGDVEGTERAEKTANRSTSSANDDNVVTCVHYRLLGIAPQSTVF